MEIQVTDSDPCLDVVRIDSHRWRTEVRHERTMQTLVEAVKAVVSRYQGLDFPEIRARFEKEDPRCRVGNQVAFLFYGPSPLFVEDNELRMDIKGVGYQPILRAARGRVTVELP